MPRFIGKSIPRLEDERFVTGHGRYTNDIPPPDACFAYVLRSPHAHARIRTIQVEPARTRPGVLAVLTAFLDYAASTATRASPNSPIRPTRSSRRSPPSEVVPIISCSSIRRPCSRTSACAGYVGEPVALIVAQTLDQARDAAEAIEVDYEMLPAVVSIADALGPSAPQLWDGAPGNVSLRAAYGNAEAVARSFAAAALVIERDLPNQRIVNCQMEPRAASGLYDPAEDSYTLIAGGQGVVRHRGALSGAPGVPPAKVRVVSPHGRGRRLSGRAACSIPSSCWSFGPPSVWVARYAGTPTAAKPS